MNHEIKKIQDMINEYLKAPNTSAGELSDGYHTFNELYDHRAILTALAFMNLPYAWKSRIHDDGQMYYGMFIVGCPTPDGMITYHYHLPYWNLFKIPEIPHAPHFDGHTPGDVIDRIKKYIQISGRKEIGNIYFEKINKIVKDEIIPVFGDDLIASAQFLSFYN